MKSITPVISVILLVLLTIVASVSAFFFINSNVLNLESQGNLDNYPGSDNSRLNLVSITGSKAIVRNDGSSPVTEVVIFVNGELLNFTLDTPIQPGELREINYISQGVGEDLEIKVIYNHGKITQATSPASKNTENSGFDSNLTLFFSSCPVGSEVVNLNDKRTGWLSTDSHTCGCSVLSTINSLINGDFENGNDSWVIIVGQAGAFADEIYEGDYSIGEYSDYDSGVTVSSVAQLVNGTVDSINLHAFYNSSSTGQGYSGIFVYYTSETPGSSKTLAYIINGSGDIFSNCNSTQGNFFIDCSYNITSDSWQSINITGIYTHFIDKFPDADTSEGVTSIILWTQALAPSSLIISHYDTIVALLSNNGKYCEYDNFYNYAKGVCYQGSCLKNYVESFTSDTSYLINENPVFTVKLKNFNTSLTTCTLNIGGNEYAMVDTETSASYSFSSPLSKGEYTANVSCISDSFQKSLVNYTSFLTKLKGEYDYPEFQDFLNHYSLVGEFFSDYFGKELFVIDYNSNVTHILSSNGSYITNLSFDPFVPQNSMLLADLDNNGFNELILTDNNRLYVVNNTLNVIVNITSNGSGIDSGIAIADVNESNGLEIISNNEYLTVHNRTGGLLWSTEFGGSMAYQWGPVWGPVVADISAANPGLEILGVLRNGLHMYSTNGTQLSYFDASSSNGWLISPAVAEINSSFDGLETVFIANSNSSVMSIYLLNSSFGVIWQYNYTFDNGNGGKDYFLDKVPELAYIGDVTNDGNNEILVSFQNESEWDPYYLDDHLLIFDKYGNLLTDYVEGTQGYINPVLLELDSSNPGLEILSTEEGNFRILDYQGNVLEIIGGGNWIMGPSVLADDIDDDGFLELVIFNSGDESLQIYETGASATNNIWPMHNHDLNQTGYQG
ncbi:MAG: archaellin/type IV pilin N-terminal domain-containing protein [Candidatus Nanoarchaeia archaeon]|jgi:hypothetical protein